jgi:hypothetical protein
MPLQGKARLLIALIILSVLLLALLLFLGGVLAWSAPPSALLPPSHAPDRVKPYTDRAAAQPVIFLAEDIQLLAVSPNGDMPQHGKRVANERAPAQALSRGRGLLSVSTRL